MNRHPKDFSKEPMWQRHREFLSLGASQMAQAIITLPVPDPELVSALEQLYPPRCREENETERQHERYAGMVDLVVVLRERLREAEEEVASKVTTQEIETDNVHVQSAEGSGDRTRYPRSGTNRSPSGPGNRRSA